LKTLPFYCWIQTPLMFRFKPKFLQKPDVLYRSLCSLHSFQPHLKALFPVNNLQMLTAAAFTGRPRDSPLQDIPNLIE
jgi:hypothetical protein